MIISKDNLCYTGRFDFNEEGGYVQFAWAGTSIKMNFYGTKVSAVLESTGDDFFLVVLDGQVINNCFKVGKKDIYILVEGLLEKKHSIELFKRTECFVGTTTFYGFDLHGGRLFEKDLPSDRRIEIIGDSISCGFGNESVNELCEYNPIEENSYLAYGPMAARKLGADLHMTAWSGLGLVQNYDLSPSPMPDRIDWITPMDTTKLWDFNSFKPQIVVINLCTNDFHEPYPTQETFVKGYINLINRMRHYYKQVAILCTIGPVVDGKDLELAREFVKQGVVENLKNEGAKDLYFLEFDHQRKENGYGGSFHPSLKTHELMAEQLVGKIKQILKW